MLLKTLRADCELLWN